MTADLAGRTALVTGEDIDILVNNAGVGGPVKAIVDLEPTEWDDVFAANVRSVFLMCRAFLPAMYRRGSGDVINIASDARPVRCRHRPVRRHDRVGLRRT